MCLRCVPPFRAVCASSWLLEQAGTSACCRMQTPKNPFRITDTEEVTGSIPVPPTKKKPSVESLYLRFAPQFSERGAPSLRDSGVLLELKRFDSLGLQANLAECELPLAQRISPSYLVGKNVSKFRVFNVTTRGDPKKLTNSSMI